MVVVYLKNGEKAPLPDANYVKLETAAAAASTVMLHCFFGEHEVGQFKWDEVAGYSISAPPSAEVSPQSSYEAWGVRQDA